MAIYCRVGADLKVIWGYKMAAGLDDEVDGFEVDFSYTTVHLCLLMRLG